MYFLFPVVFDFLTDNLYISARLVDIIVNCVNIALGDFHLTTTGGGEAFSYVSTECILVKSRGNTKEIGTGLSVVDNAASLKSFTHKFLVTPGGDGNLSQVGEGT